MSPQRSKTSLTDRHVELPLFLAAASFEPRSVNATLTTVAENQFYNAVIFRYEDTLDLDLARRNFGQMVESLQTKVEEKVHIVKCSFKDPYSAVRSLDVHFASNLPEDALIDVTIDITCFTKLHLLMLLKFLQEHAAVRRVSGLYTEPISYATAIGRQLSYGISRTVYLPYKVSGSNSRRVGVIAFLGHERLRLERIIQELEPDRLVIVFGEPGFSENMEDYSRSVNAGLLHRATFDPHCHLVSAPVGDVDETELVLYRAVRRMQADKCSSVYFAALGTKLQTIAIDRVRRRIDLEIGMLLAYSIPERYERGQYSLGSGPVHPVDLTAAPAHVAEASVVSPFTSRVDPIAETAVCDATLAESSFTKEDVAKRLHTTLARVSGMIRRREILSFLRRHRRLIPRFQFLDDGPLIEHISEVNATLPEDLELVEVYDWYTNPHPDLQVEDELPMCPLEWLRSGLDSGRVLVLANGLQAV